MPRPAAHRPPDRIVAHTIGLDAEVTVIGWHLVERNGQMISEWDVADHAASFHKGSAYPGRAGNTVLSGHHNIRGEVFRYLYDLEPGDLISLHVGEQEYQYAVREVLLTPERDVSPDERRDNARWIGYFPDERLTLVTCWPYSGNTHRVIVIAHPSGRGS
jgi:sortase A